MISNWGSEGELKLKLLLCPVYKKTGLLISNVLL
jgi:hypothetical protein